MSSLRALAAVHADRVRAAGDRAAGGAHAALGARTRVAAGRREVVPAVAVGADLEDLAVVAALPAVERILGELGVGEAGVAAVLAPDRPAAQVLADAVDADVGASVPALAAVVDVGQEIPAVAVAHRQPRPALAGAADTELLVLADVLAVAA